MIDSTVHNGWKRLPSGYDLEFRNNVPSRLSDNGAGERTPDPELVREIADLTSLRVRLGEWETGEKPGERECPVYVSDEQFAEVLRRLARSSAAVFFDRFHKPVEKTDVDWDRLEYLKDFRTALEHCNLQWGEVDHDVWLDDYVQVMHRETARIAETHESPLVAPEEP